MTDSERMLESLNELAHDCWWSWNEIGRRPFAMLDPRLWEATRQSPKKTLNRCDPSRLHTRLNSVEFKQVVEKAIAARQKYYDSRTWFSRISEDDIESFKVAYFCSEFAIHESMQQYSGGLGVLAGDHVKSASDLGLPFVGISLLYQHGYYIQEIAQDGQTRVVYPNYEFDDMPLEDTGVDIQCPLWDRDVIARIWKMKVGRSELLLLDANRDGNSDEDRLLTEGLYKGDPDPRMRQQILLGVGGMQALDALGYEPTVYHLNEGHAAFAPIYRIGKLIREGLSKEEAIEQIKESTVFTTHTPVPAGHDRYAADRAADALGRTLESAQMSREEFEALGREHPENHDEQLCMTVLALRMADFVNGVAQLHGEVSREMWQEAYGCEHVDDVPINAITNGIHIRTWLAPAADAFWRREIGLRPGVASPHSTQWSRAMDANPNEFWDLRTDLRTQMIEFLRRRLAQQAMKNGADPDSLREISGWFDPDALTIGFARRFATYKRAPLIFRDIDRIEQIVDNLDFPVQLIFAGKAHPRDQHGQAFAQKIHRLSKRPRLKGRVAILEEYDMEIGRMLTSGCDIWLNNPRRPHEASGTSGMKPPLHGGLNVSILDGWWPEGFDGRNGWAIGDESEFESTEHQDEHDSNELYQLLEEKIVPLFYTRNNRDVPRGWIKRALRSVATIPDFFNTNRMVGQYADQAYLTAHRSRKNRV
ncbi:MAG: alpha-glucan phosphorylase [Planctomycetaceae bacterium]|nr:alpha-glucan phosphorylase [Planctomycetaceae bacterium]